MLGKELTTWNRQTYSVLDYVGDIGGLFDGLRYACKLILAPLSSYALQNNILTTLFRQQTTDADFGSTEDTKMYNESLRGEHSRKGHAKAIKKDM